jgi:hypothetical protein
MTDEPPALTLAAAQSIHDAVAALIDELEPADEAKPENDQ